MLKRQRLHFSGLIPESTSLSHGHTLKGTSSTPSSRRAADIFHSILLAKNVFEDGYLLVGQTPFSNIPSARAEN